MKEDKYNSILLIFLKKSIAAKCMLTGKKNYYNQMIISIKKDDQVEKKDDDDPPFSGPSEPICHSARPHLREVLYFLEALCYRPDQSSWIWSMQVALVEYAVGWDP